METSLPHARLYNILLCSQFARLALAHTLISRESLVVRSVSVILDCVRMLGCCHSELSTPGVAEIRGHSLRCVAEGVEANFIDLDVSIEAGSVNIAISCKLHL